MSRQTRKALKSIPFNALHGCPPGYQKRTSYKNGALFNATRCIPVALAAHCPKGMIRRKGYTRRYSTGIRRRGYTVRRTTGTHYRVYPEKTHMIVKSSCIKDRGLPGKGPREGKGIGKLDKGKLSRYGYSYHDSVDKRHESLKKAINVYTALSVFHKLDAVAKYTIRTAPQASHIFAEDRDWVRSSFM